MVRISLLLLAVCLGCSSDIDRRGPFERAEDRAERKREEDAYERGRRLYGEGCFYVDDRPTENRFLSPSIVVYDVIPTCLPVEDVR